MKYIKPELNITKVETQPIASGLGQWLENTEYKGTEDYITNFVMNS